MVCGEAWLRHTKTDRLGNKVRPVTDGDIGLKVLREAPAEAAQIIECVLSLRCSLSELILRLRQHRCNPWHWRPPGRELVPECRHSGEPAVGQLARQG
jgi:hypothetical protein